MAGSCCAPQEQKPLLWGLRGRSEYLYDGSAREVSTAIKLHNGQGGPAAQAFDSLTVTQQQDVINFLNTL